MMRAAKLFVTALALISAVGPQLSLASPVGGPQYGVHRVEANSTVSFDLRCHLGERTHVCVSGDGDTDLDVRIYDESGRVVAYDTDYTDQAAVSWVPRGNKKFRIEVRNLGSVYNQFEIAVF